jgi:predicted TIM-barrel fold metal-dependent hydrolase
MRLDLGPLVDHHCHGLATDDLDRPAFESMMSEAEHPSPLGTTLFDSTLGLAIRRWCAPVLDLDPHTPADAYLARRRELGAAEVNRRFVTEAGIATFLVDTGLNADQLTTPEELAATCGGTSHEIVRLESVAAAVLADGTSPSGFADEVEARLRARFAAGAVGAKSIAAYRVGLGLPGRRATGDELVAALSDVRPDASGGFRVAQPVVNGWLAWTAIELGMPLQFHVGYGDNDVDLADCDPLRLTAFLRATQDRGVPVLLLHNYPFHRNAAYLAQVFDQVFMDVGLATHNTGALSGALVRESLELVPFGKLLFSSDAYGLAELYHLGALLFRRGLAGVLDALVDDDEMSAADADDVARLVGRDNARRAYRLDGADVPG